jgi:hypothetical protein
MSWFRFVTGAIALGAMAMWWLLPYVTIGVVERVDTGVSGTTAVSLLSREESETRVRGSSRYVPRLESVTRWNLVLIGNDVGTAQPRWHRSLLTTHERDIAQGAKIITVDGDRVWLLADQLYGVDATTGEVVADTARLEAAAPALRGLVPTEAKYFTHAPYSKALIVTAADGRVWRIDATTLAATPPIDERAPPATNGEELRPVPLLTAQFAFGTGPDDFKVDGDILGDRWVGLIADDETKSIIGQWDTPMRSSSTPRRRRLWRARVTFGESSVVGRTAEISDPTPVQGGAEFLTGGLLRHSDHPRPVRTTDPDGFLVLHTDRLGEDGRYLLTRIDAEGRPRWTSALPLQRVQDLWPTDRALLLVGPERRPDEIRGSALLVGLDLASGRCGVFDVQTATMLAGDCTSPD